VSAEDNVRVIQSLYQAFGAADLPGLLSHVAEDVVWEVPEIPGVAASGKFHGHDGVARFFSELAADEDLSAFEPGQFLTGEGTVAVLGHAAGKVRSTGKPFELAFVHVFKLNDGKVVSFRDYYDSHLVAEAYRP
jgi:ketosteroid isomerase-like protein